VSRARFGSLPWSSRSQHDLAAKSCLPHNLVVWSLILKLFYRNDHHNEIKCREQIWVDTLKVKVTAWHCSKTCPVHNFVIGSQILQLFHRNDHHIEMMCCAQHLGRFLEGQGHSMTLQQKRVWPITLLFKVGFYNYFTEMITILGWHVVHNILVATLKVKVTAWPCTKIVSGS